MVSPPTQASKGKYRVIETTETKDMQGQAMGRRLVKPGGIIRQLTPAGLAGYFALRERPPRGTSEYNRAPPQ